ncbi:MAG: GNAT family N-acetyltransferase [Candidatus Riflebacteria bacterium]|nr:GNAT family N-acetyltransferase [Candidatus Riflebacteria bacterium]
MKFEILITDRLKLRLLTPEVEQYVFENYSENDLKIFFGCNTEAEFAKEKVRYERGSTTWNKSFLNFLLIDKATELVIGRCGFHTWYLEHRRAEIGYNLTNGDFKDKGLMTEAIKKVIEYGFEKINLNRIEAFIGKDNVPSLKLIKRMNFIEEGLLRQHFFKNNVIEDSLVFGLLREDYYKKLTPQIKLIQ